MGKTRDIIIVMVVTVLLIGGLGLWVGYRNGELTFLYSDTYDDENFDYPRSLDAQNNESITQVTMEKTNESNPTITFKTNRGDITLELFADTMPITAGNFLKLAQENFYDGTKFHRVINNFMIQGGDPNSKGDNVATYGTGGPGYAIADEHVAGQYLTNARGTISMANSGPNSGGSQFFINLVDNTFLDFDKEPLASKHPVFGRVISGMDIVDAIAGMPTNERDLPLEAVVVEDIVVGE